MRRALCTSISWEFIVSAIILWYHKVLINRRGLCMGLWHRSGDGFMSPNGYVLWATSTSGLSSRAIFLPL